MTRPPLTGFVAHEGPSRLDGAPIVVIVTLRSHNSKIGDMAQAWVLRADVSPSEAIAHGLDRSICGDCVHRSGAAVGRACYVIWWLGPTNIYRAFREGRYPTLGLAAAAQALAGEQLRVTGYGDPAAAPFEVWRELLSQVAGFTAYSHQWRTCDQRFRTIAMASVESAGEVDQAAALGWRTFRTRLARERLRDDEVICPASDEAGHRVQCEACGLCRGQARAGAKSVAIIAHGQRLQWFVDAKAAAEARACRS